jgi:hypothetical protein
MPGGGGYDEAVETVYAYGTLRLPRPDGGFEALGSVTWRPSERDLILVPGPMYTPDASFYRQLNGDEPHIRSARQFVPMPTHLPPLVGAGRRSGARALWARQASLQLALRLEMTEHALEILETGYLHLTDERKRRLAEMVGLRYRDAEATFDHWRMTMVPQAPQLHLAGLQGVLEPELRIHDHRPELIRLGDPVAHNMILEHAGGQVEWLKKKGRRLRRRF